MTTSKPLPKQGLAAAARCVLGEPTIALLGGGLSVVDQFGNRYEADGWTHTVEVSDSIDQLLGEELARNVLGFPR